MNEVEQVIASQFADELAACDELHEFARSCMDPWRGRELESGSPSADWILAMELARATKTFEAIIRLCRAGFGEQAAMLNRSLFEGMLVAHWVAANPTDAAERFADARELEGHITADTFKRMGWLESPDELDELRLEPEHLTRLQSKFGKTGTRLWTGHHSISQLMSRVEDQWTTKEGQTQLRAFGEVVNRVNNELLHSTAGGLHRTVSDNDPEGLKLWVGASNVHIEQALFAAFWIYANLLGLVFQTFELDPDGVVDQILDRNSPRFRKLTKRDVAGVGRNDPCPCGSGLKYKRCHLDQVQRTG